MKTNPRYVVSLLVVFLLGYAAASWQANAQSAPPAYMIVSAEFLEPDKLGPYEEKAVPLAKQAGMVVVAQGASGSTVEVLEGDWPYKGAVVIEKYDSMDALLSFWNSPGYQEAKKLREGHVQTNFIIAVEAAGD